MLEYLRFALFAILLIGGLLIEITSVLGVNRFRYSINRMHAAGMGDTLGLMLICLAAIVYNGLDVVAIKIILVVAFFWLTSPVCGHLLGRLVSEADERFEAEAKQWKR